MTQRRWIALVMLGVLGTAFAVPGCSQDTSIPGVAPADQKIDPNALAGGGSAPTTAPRNLKIRAEGPASLPEVGSGPATSSAPPASASRK